MSFCLHRLIARLAFGLSCLLVTPSSVFAETDSGQDHWEIGGAAYLWFAGIEATSVAGDKIDISFSDVLDSLDGGIMGIVAARKGRWTLLGDIQYLSISDKTSSTANIIGLPLEIDVHYEQTGFVSTFGVAYRVFDDDRTNLDLLVGGRYVNMDVDVDLDTGAGITGYSDSEDALDGIIGAQAIIALNDRWYFSFYGDIGGGDSNKTWQAWPSIGYRLEKLDVVAGYRHLEWETDDGDTFDDMNFNGPLIGVKFSF
jgi:hypothetical protein